MKTKSQLNLWESISASKGGLLPNSGMALQISLVLSSVFGLVLLGYLNLVSWNFRSSMRSQTWNETIPVAEAGIEEALAHLNERGPDGLATDQWVESDSYVYMNRQLGAGRYQVWVSQEVQPVLYAQGNLKAPNSDQWVSRALRVTTQSLPLFFKGLVAKDTFDLHGNNIETDSFDSKDPAFNTDGRYDSTKVKAGGDIATNSRIINSLDVGNAKIKGKISSGPEGTPAIGPNGIVGDLDWHAAGSRGIQPGWYSDDMNVEFPEVEAPTSFGWYPGPGVVDGVYYKHILNSGTYGLLDLRLSGSQKVLVRGNAKLVVNQSINMTGQSSITIDEGASLQVFMKGSSTKIAGNGVINLAGNAMNFQYWGTPGNETVALSGNSAFIGTIYAPDAHLTLGGGGSDTLDFIGAGIADSIDMNGHYRFHYDENLGREGPKRGWIAASWNEVGLSDLPNQPTLMSAN